MKKNSRIFSYVELICLSGFQVILFFVFLDRLHEAENAVYPPQTVLRMVFPPEDSDNSEFGKQFSVKASLSKWEKDKKIFIVIDLTGEFSEDQKRMTFIRNEARRIKYTHDTTHIIKVHFTAENTYGQFVDLVNIMTKDRHKRYLFYKDDFYILGETPSE